MPIELVKLADTLASPTTRQETFITTASGTAQNETRAPKKCFTIQATKTGSVTSWTILLEGSLDGVTYTTILTHTNVDPADGGHKFSGTSAYPVNYWRLRCSALTLGGGTNVVAVGLATN